ncbi:hypothetical protein ROZALSC1DRAFT_24478 [Rozella allomycis CSF55]|uniref:Uncharacterized protein n=1 Tax=Rozella allomycis (strain CSF55) TaxID=988480 RepID=A0A4P9YDB1_ROZAC|nr:hypothetical protein ROZALSC1DRAFT_24478 [Rozella allomycis CSF55]
MVVNDDKEKKKRAKNREYLRKRLKITKHLETKQTYDKNLRKKNASISQHVYKRLMLSETPEQKKCHKSLLTSGIFRLSASIVKSYGVNSSDILNQLQSTKNSYESIFQDKSDAFALNNKSFRKNFNSPRKQAKIDLGRAFKDKMNKIARDYVGENYFVSDFVALKSECNCPEQAVHSDYDTSLSNQFAENFPLGAILALEHGTRLKVFKGSINTVTVTKEQMMEVKIPKGSIAFFLGYLPHAGCHYENENTRIHFLCSHRDVNINTAATYIIDLDENDDYLPSYSIALAPENNEYAYNTRSASKRKPIQ